jgi:peroxiredoxin family protein
VEQAKIALIINSPSFDRVSYALSIAAVSAAQMKEVYVLFTYGALCRLVKNQTDVVGDETDEWIRGDIKTGLTTNSIHKISEMILHLKGFGGKIYACAAAMKFHQLNTDDLIDAVDDITGIASFLENTDGATMLYI